MTRIMISRFAEEKDFTLLDLLKKDSTNTGTETATIFIFGTAVGNIKNLNFTEVAPFLNRKVESATFFREENTIQIKLLSQYD